MLRVGSVRRGRGAKIFVAKDMVHADYVFDARLWEREFGLGGRYVKIGWGDRRIFLETRTWGELKAKDFVRAFFGLNPTVLRVDFSEKVPAGARELEIDEFQLEAIRSHILRSYRRGPPVERKPSDYQGGEFYESELRYNCVTNCNNWVNRGMFLAGVTNRLWCPLSLWL